MPGDTNFLNDLLDRDWREDDLHTAARLSQKLAASPEAQQRLREYDHLRDMLAADVDDVQVEPSRGWDAFHDRLQEAVQRQEAAAISRWSLRTWPPVAHALAALIFLSAGLTTGILLAGRNVAIDGNPLALDLNMGRSSHVMLSPSEVQQQVSAFVQVADTLDHRAAWVALNSPEPTLGLADSPVHADRLLLIRLVATCDNLATTTRDMLILPGQNAELIVSMGQYEIRYLIAASDSESTSSLWVEIRYAGSRKILGALATEISPDGNTMNRVGQVSTIAGDFRVFMGSKEVPLVLEYAQ